MHIYGYTDNKTVQKWPLWCSTGWSTVGIREADQRIHPLFTVIRVKGLEVTLLSHHQSDANEILWQHRVNQRQIRFWSNEWIVLGIWSSELSVTWRESTTAWFQLKTQTYHVASMKGCSAFIHSSTSLPTSNWGTGRKLCINISSS